MELTIKNPHIIDGLTGNMSDYMIRYEGKDLTVGYDNYSWVVVNVLGNMGKMIIDRTIIRTGNRRGNLVNCYWYGNEVGDTLLSVNELKDPMYMKRWMVECIDGYFDK